MFDLHLQLDEKEKSPIKEDEIKRILKDSLKCLDLGLTGKLEIEILFVDKNYIKDLNSRYRKKNEPTDVLSFPQEQVKESKVKLLGSIVICYEKVIEKNEDLSSVIKHGLLHILGYDHETDEASWTTVAEKINCTL